MRDLKIRRRRRRKRKNEDVKKAIGLITKTTILHVYHTFLYISLPSLHDYNIVAAGPRTRLNHIEGLERLRCRLLRSENA